MKADQIAIDEALSSFLPEHESARLNIEKGTLSTADDK